MIPIYIFYLVLVLPILGGLVTWIFRAREYSVWASIVSILLSFFASLLLVFRVGKGSYSIRFEWLPAIDLGWYLDPISVSLISLVLFVSLMVHLFSLQYMRLDRGKGRYFGLLGFFTFSMVAMLGADHLILLFIFWELVGFSSYLLIGFWYQVPENALSARIGFITNRVADVLLITSILVIWVNTGNGLISEIDQHGMTGSWWTLAGLGIVIGAFGKSAQFPFFNWLPRAMAGPTPVSALIHAATMVAAGVYLLVRLEVIFIYEIKLVAATIGAVTMLIGALSAISQTDIKKVLAYSTISQLGYMVLAVGVGAREMALFHLWTHAFFKAGLFLCAGSIIHQVHLRNPSVDPQDMRLMGGLRKAMPVTFWVYLVCMLSLSGLPLFSGFISKEGIILAAFQWAQTTGVIGSIISIVAVIGVFFTSFYMARQAIWVFFGTYRGGKSLVKWSEPNLSVKLPFILLALGSIWIVYAMNPFSHNPGLLGYWFPSFSVQMTAYGGIITVGSIVLTIFGIVLAHRFYSKKEAAILQFAPTSSWQKLSFHAFFLDRIYMNFLVPAVDRLSAGIRNIDSKIIDPAVDWLGMSFVVLSKLMDLFDKLVIDKLVLFSALLSATIGDVIRLAHSRRVQLHVVWAVLGMIGILIWIYNFGIS